MTLERRALGAAAILKDGARPPHSPAKVRQYQGRLCPCCEGHLYRVPRRVVDVLLSILLPVHRYRCRSEACGWEGNLRKKTPSRPDLDFGDGYGEGSYILEPSQMGPAKRDHQVAP